MTRTWLDVLRDWRDWITAKLFGAPQFCKRCGLRAGREPLHVTEVEQDGDDILTHLSDGRCAVNKSGEQK